MTASEQFDIYNNFSINSIQHIDYSSRCFAPQSVMADIKNQLEQITTNIETNGLEKTAKLLNDLLKDTNPKDAKILRVINELKNLVRVVYTDAQVRYIYKSLNDEGGFDVKILDVEGAHQFFKKVKLSGLQKVKVGGEMCEVSVWYLLEKYTKHFLVDRISFNNQNDPDAFNLFSGFPYQRLPEINVAKIQKHLDHWKNQLCGGSEEQYDYLLKWLGNSFQHPEKVGRTALVFLSRQGVGKSIFFTDHIVALAGRVYGCTESDAQNIFGHFNAKLEQKTHVILDEATNSEERSTHFRVPYDRLKSLLTGSTISITKKGRDTFDLDNVLHLIIVSNNNLPCRIDDNDRRLVYFDVSNELAAIPEDVERSAEILEKERVRNEYFDALDKEAHDEDFYPTLFSYLLSIDVSKWDPEHDRPHTQTKTIVLERSENPLKSFVEEHIEDISNERLSTKEAHDLYKQFCVSNGHRYQSNLPNFLADLKQMFDIDRHRTSDKKRTVLYLTEAGNARYKHLLKESSEDASLADIIKSQYESFLQYIPQERVNEFKAFIKELSAEPVWLLR